MEDKTTWFFDIDTILFSALKNQLLTKFSERFPSIYVTNSDRATNSPLFPNVYFHALSFNETGQDLEGSSINGVDASFQIDVTTNSSQNEAREVMEEIVLFMKKHRFIISPMPEFQNEDNVYRIVMRASRVFGVNDTL